jgi:hypothetical protein
MSSNTSQKKFYELSTILPDIPQDYSNGVSIPFKSFTSKDIYVVTLNLNKASKKWKFQCNCGTKFNIGKRTKCKHISYLILSLFEELNEPESHETDLLKTFDAMDI